MLARAQCDVRPLHAVADHLAMLVDLDLDLALDLALALASAAPGRTGAGKGDDRAAAPLTIAHDRSASPGEGATTAPTTTGPHRIAIQAEDGLLTPPMQLVVDDPASGTTYVAVEGDTGGETLGAVEFAFDVPRRATYRIVGRIQGPAPTANSFFVSVDGQPPADWHVIASGDDGERWRWQVVTAAGAGPAPSS